MRRHSCCFVALFCLAPACLGADGHDDGGHDPETEVISRVRLTFTPAGAGAPVVAAFTDPDGDGGASGTADPIVLAAATTYTLTIAFTNTLADPEEDITAEIQEEAEEHQVFVYGDGVRGPASSSATAIAEHAYDDRESDYGDNAVGEDLPVGLRHTVTTVAAGEGQLSVMLRHMPETDGAVMKQPGLAELLASGGALPGDVDADVTFALTVQ